MARKDKDTILDKKTKEQFKQDIMEEINTKYKDEICSSIVEDVKRSFDHEYKQGLRKEISDEIIVDIRKDIAKEQKKLSRSKSFKIFRLYLYIILLIAVACYMIYCLYKSDNLELLRTKGITDKKTTITTTTKPTVVNKDLNWYINEYGSLLDNVKITNYSLLSNNVVMAALSSDLRLELAYQVLDKSSIVVDGIINSISEDAMKDAYVRVFGSEEGYIPTNFVVNGLNYAYSANNKSYMVIYQPTVESVAVTNKIVDIVENNDSIVITAIVAVVIDGSVYNVEDLEKEVGEDSDLTIYANSLTTVDYKFNKINDNYYIDSITKR